MISGNAITYPNAQAPFETWGPDQQTLLSFLVAVLSTVLAYQTTAIMFDLILGRKPRGEACITDFSLLLLAEELSPLSIAANLSGSPTLAKVRTQGVLLDTLSADSSEEAIVRKPIPRCLSTKLLILVISVPLVNLIAVIITLERDREITFGSAKFDGIALGVNANLSTIETCDHDLYCRTFQTSYGKGETAVAEFFSCLYVLISGAGPDAVPDTLVMSSSTREDAPFSSILLEYTFSDPTSGASLVLRSIAHIDVGVRRASYRLFSLLTAEQGEILFARTVQRIQQTSDSNTTGEVEVEQFPSRSGLIPRWRISQKMRIVTGPSELMAMLRGALLPITVVDSEQRNFIDLAGLQSSQIEEVSTVPMDSVPLLVRRRSFVSFATLCIVVAAVAAVRILVRLFTNNDIHQGIEMIMKDLLNIKACDSILQNRVHVHYSGESGNKFYWEDAVDGKVGTVDSLVS
eukprot:GFKZ01011843.1.p1 GENE.GFKZ01011843.1~~GFKZ01011843.1.p1  ORF type:complete len:462 (-),score=51.73 GFKZ01011843.1:509-1894(-)